MVDYSQNTKHICLSPRRLWAIIVFSAMLLPGCDHESGIDVQKRYVSNQEHGLLQIQQGQWFEYRLQYQTADVLAAQAIKAEGLPQEEFKKVRQNYEEHHYFLLSIKPKSPTKSIQETLHEASEDPAQAESLWNTLQFGLQPFLKLSCGTDTLTCVQCHTQAPIFKNGAMQINLVFSQNPSKGKHKNADLIISSNIPSFPEPIPVFTIKRSNLTQIPTLNL